MSEAKRKLQVCLRWKRLSQSPKEPSVEINTEPDAKAELKAEPEPLGGASTAATEEEVLPGLLFQVNRGSGVRHWRGDAFPSNACTETGAGNQLQPSAVPRSGQCCVGRRLETCAWHQNHPPAHLMDLAGMYGPGTASIRSDCQRFPFLSTQRCSQHHQESRQGARQTAYAAAME